MTDLTIVIVTWNSREDIEECLKSILSASSRHRIQTAVVDNGSADGTAEFVRSGFPSVGVTANPGNRGFGAANNQVLGSASSRYFLLLNPDTVVQGSALDSLIDFMDANPDVWASGPSMINADGKPQRTGVRFPGTWNILVETLFLDRLFPRSRTFGRHKELYEPQDKPREVDCVQGSCLIVREDAMRKVGLLDEGFFLYFEETDWCYRMKAAGGKVSTCPSAVVVHRGGGEFAHYDETRLVNYHRSLLRFYLKHYGMADRLAVRLVLEIRALIRLFLWLGAALARPGTRRNALSSARGYAKSFLVLVRGS